MLFFIIFVKIEISLKFYFYYIKMAMHQKVVTLLDSLYLMFCLLVANLKSELDFHN